MADGSIGISRYPVQQLVDLSRRRLRVCGGCRLSQQNGEYSKRGGITCTDCGCLQVRKAEKRGIGRGGTLPTSSLSQCVPACSDLGPGVVGGSCPRIGNLAAWERILAEHRDLWIIKLKKRLGMGSPFPI